MKKYFHFLASLLLLTSLTFGQTPITPTNGLTGVSQATPAVNWTDFNEGPSTDGPYDAEFDDDGGFGSIDASASATISTSLNIPALAYNTTYSWRVRDADIDDITGGNQPGTWFTYSFTTEIATPVVTVPAASSIDLSTTPSIEWTLADGTAGVTFNVEISDDGFVTTEYSATNVTSPHVVGTALDFNTNYDVRVIAVKSLEANKTSSPVAFKTGFPAVSLDSPADAADLTDRTPTLEWSPASAVSNVTYTLDVVGDNGFTSNSVETSPYTFGSNLNYGGYTWNITIDDSNTPLDNTPVASASRTFNILPELVSPANTLTGVSITPELEWVDDGVSTYKVQIATSTDFVGDLLVEKSLPSGFSSHKFTGYDFAEIPLNNNTIYYWRVIAVSGGNDYASAAWSFRTLADLSISAGNPLDAAMVHQYDPLLFNWFLNQAQGNLKFMLEIYESPTAPTHTTWASFEITAAQGANPVHFYDNVNTTSKSVTGLEGGKRYYWRVMAYYDDGTTVNEYDVDDRVAKISPVYYFDTKGGAVEAYPSWPTGGALVYTLQPYFYYYTLEYEPSATFEVIVSTSATTGVNGDLTPAFTYSAGSNLFVQASADLTAGTIYYWQVKTTYGSEVTYSSVSSFETDAIAGVVAYVPTPSYPTGGALVYTTSPYLYWWVGGVSTDLRFEIEINTTNTFTGTATHSAVSGLYYQTSGLTAGATYYWKVRSYENGNMSNASAWSSTGEFTVAGGISNGYPVASYPVNNPTVYSATPTVSWYLEGSSLGITEYHVTWRKDSAPADWTAYHGGSNPKVIISDINQTTYTFTTALEYGSTYYWAVASYDGSTHSAWAQGSFTVVGGSSVTVIPSVPSDGSVEYNRDVTFYWYLGGSSLGIQGYELQYSQTSNFSLVTTVPSGTVGTNMFYTVTGLTPGATYYWRVRGDYGSGNYTSYSTIYSFTVDAGASAVVPRIGSPARGVTVETGSPVLSWFNPVQSSSSLSYDVELSRNAEFTESVVYTDVNQLQAEASNLESGEYFWRVRSKTNEEISGYSESGNFKVKDGITSVAEESEVLPTVYELSQNYPNPFNPETTIKFSLAESQYVSIKIYNMLGQEVRTLMNEQRNQGSYNVLWNGKDNNGNQVSSGTYIYRIRAGEFVSTKKMVLLK